MQHGKLIKIALVLSSLWMSPALFAGQDPVSVTLTAALSSPIVVGAATPTTYTFTNNLPFAVTPIITSNNSAYIITSSTCTNVVSKKQCQVIATYTPSSVSTPAPQLTVTYGTTQFSLKQTPTIVSTPVPGSLTLTATPGA